MGEREDADVGVPGGDCCPNVGGCCGDADVVDEVAGGKVVGAVDDEVCSVDGVVGVVVGESGGVGDDGDVGVELREGCGC